MSAQNAASTTLCVELLSVLNNCGPAHGDIASSLLQVALQWIESSPMSVLLLPMMSAACQCLASTNHMVRCVETCCDTYFSRGLSYLSCKHLAQLRLNTLHSVLRCQSINQSKRICVALYVVNVSEARLYVIFILVRIHFATNIFSF